mmetsp:Transcript_2179/g.6284  ORF Transcript_2179/g.6284 Transcript_2179/m.6284 type:complete len:221 (+) Transcript_2179:1284-1946(+)
MAAVRCEACFALAITAFEALKTGALPRLTHSLVAPSITDSPTAASELGLIASGGVDPGKDRAAVASALHHLHHEAGGGGLHLDGWKVTMLPQETDRGGDSRVRAEHRADTRQVALTVQPVGHHLETASGHRRQPLEVVHEEVDGVVEADPWCGLAAELEPKSVTILASTAGAGAVQDLELIGAIHHRVVAHSAGPEAAVAPFVSRVTETAVDHVCVPVVV